MNKEYTMNKTNKDPVKEYQLERWNLPESDFPMDMAEFEFTDLPNIIGRNHLLGDYLIDKFNLIEV